ncbi:unnamed protein product, partial [Discosporangium mesarthrocarpum]
LPHGVKDIDADIKASASPHLLNAEYSREHARYLREQERKNRPSPHVFSGRDIRQGVRGVLVDWIVEVCDQFRMSSRALFQVVELMDRALSAMEVPRGRLQLLGCACIILAAKFEEIYAPTAEELAHISDNTYTRAEIICMELEVTQALRFRLFCVTPVCFVDRFCRAAGSGARERSLVSYLLELLLQDHQAVQLLPSCKAAAALYLARQTLHPSGGAGKGRAWTRQTEHYTGYSPGELEVCVRRLHALHLRAEGHHLKAVRDKYSRACHHSAANVTCALDQVLEFG